MSENGIPLSEAVVPRIEKAMPSDFPDEPFIGLDDIEAHTTRLLGSKPSESMKSAAKRFYPGDVLYSRLRPYLNKVWLADRTGLCSSEFIVLPASDAVDGAFLKYRLNAMDFVAFASSLNAGDRPRVDFDQIGSFLLPAFPVSYQKRIVAKIEELFSELEAGEESLRAARRQLGVYRQSLLKQAFEGKLTETWRAENPRDTVAPNVPAITSDKELGTLDTLPAGWVWTYLSNLGELGRGKSKHRPRNDAKLFGGPYPFIQTGEVKAASKTVTNYTETYSEFGLAQSKLWPKGTLCITIAANIAETAFLGFDACFPDSVVGFVPNRDIANTEFVELFIRSVRSRIEKYAPATAQKNINLTTLESLVVPLCSLPEQQEIVRLLDEQFEAIERNEREIDAALKRSEALRQAILKKAFTGQLVPQVATDEPASELLARIRAERNGSDYGRLPWKTAQPVSPAVAFPVAPADDLFPELKGFKPLGKTDLQAGIVALACDRFAKRNLFFGHTIAEKVVHLADALAELEFERQPVKDAAGPNDFKRAKKVEHRAKTKGWFEVYKQEGVYRYEPGRNFHALLQSTEQTLGAKLPIIENLVEHLCKLRDTRSIEIFATVYAAWNNLLLRRVPVTDKAIVTEARENWHSKKLEIDRQRFFGAIKWMKHNGFVAKGTGREVAHAKS